jgi:Zn-finger nucleic acid-binding protein
MAALFVCVSCGYIGAEWELARDEDVDADICPSCGSLWIEESEDDEYDDEPEAAEG